MSYVLKSIIINIDFTVLKIKASISILMDKFNHVIWIYSRYYFNGNNKIIMPHQL